MSDHVNVLEARLIPARGGYESWGRDDAQAYGPDWVAPLPFTVQETDAARAQALVDAYDSATPLDYHGQQCYVIGFTVRFGVPIPELAT